MFVWECLILITSVITILFVKKLTTQPKSAIFNVYQRPGSFYWLKVCFMYIILSIRKLRPGKIDYLKYEKHQTLSISDKPIDAVYFNSSNSNGDYLITGMARRKWPLIDGFMFIKLEKFGLLRTPKLPKTSLMQDESEEGFEAEGIKFIPVAPMKKWKVNYQGKMVDEDGKSRDVKLTAEWSSKLPWFNFDCDMDPLLMAKGIAKEKWSRDYFDTVKFIHQTHYEQPGELKGTVCIDGVKHDLKLNSLRDHSFGYKREWRNFHRYGLHFVNVENGDRINVGMVSMPIAFSSLYIGYIYNAKDAVMYPIQDCDFQLYQHGEDGEPPENYAFTFKAGNRQYLMEVEVMESPEFYLSEDCESRVVERLCRFKVNGKDGWGAAEWQYRNIEGERYLSNK